MDNKSWLDCLVEYIDNGGQLPSDFKHRLVGLLGNIIYTKTSKDVTDRLYDRFYEVTKSDLETLRYLQEFTTTDYQELVRAVLKSTTFDFDFYLYELIKLYFTPIEVIKISKYKYEYQPV